MVRYDEKKNRGLPLITLQSDYGNSVNNPKTMLNTMETLPEV